MKNTALFFCFLIFSCFQCGEDECTAIIEVPTYINSMKIENLDNSGENPDISQSNEIAKAAFGMQLIFEIDKSQAGNIFCPKYYLEDTIVDIRIFTMYDFNEQYLEGDEITNIFFIMTYEYSLRNYSKISDHLKIPPYSFGNGNYRFDEEVINIFLATPPTLNTFHQFKIEIEMSNKKKFVELSPKVQLI